MKRKISFPDWYSTITHPPSESPVLSSHDISTRVMIGDWQKILLI
jgi:hypothetical protein